VYGVCRLVGRDFFVHPAAGAYVAIDALVVYFTACMVDVWRSVAEPSVGSYGATKQLILTTSKSVACSRFIVSIRALKGRLGYFTRP